MSKVTVYVDADERYPDYLLSDEQDGFSKPVEVEADTLERWKRVIAEYEVVQDEIEAAKGGRDQ